MPFFPTKFTKRLASTIDLIQGVQSNSNDVNGKPVQYVTGAFAPMYRERKPSSASQFIHTAMAKANQNPSIEKSRDLFRKLSKKHAPHEVRSMLKESIVVIRNPDNDDITPICEVEDFGSKGMTKYQLEAVDEDPFYRPKPVDAPLPPVPVNSHPYGHTRQFNNRTLRAVASVGSIRSRDSSDDSSGDSPPIGTPRDSFGQEPQDYHYGHSRSPSNGSTHSRTIHAMKSTPLLNRSLQKRVALNTPLVRPLDVAMMEVSQPDYQYRPTTPHYIKQSDRVRDRDHHRNSIDSGLDADVESRLGRPLSWDSDIHSQDFHISSPTSTEFNFRGRNVRDSYGTIESDDWHAEVAPVNVARLSSMRPLMVAAPPPRVIIPPPVSTAPTMASRPFSPSPQFEHHLESIKISIDSRSMKSGKFTYREGESFDPTKPTSPLRPSRSQASLRLRAKRPAPTPPCEIPPVPALPAAFAKFPTNVTSDNESDMDLITSPVHRQRRISWGTKDAPAAPLSKFIGGAGSGSNTITNSSHETSSNYISTNANSIEIKKTLPLTITPKTPRPKHRRLSRELPPPPPSEPIANHGLSGSLERMRATGNTHTLARSKSAHGLGSSSRSGYGQTKHSHSNNSSSHSTLVHPQRHGRLSCGLCEANISPSTPSICSLKCYACSSTLCAECFEVFTSIDETIHSESDSDYSDDEAPLSPGAIIHMSMNHRKKLARKARELQMAQCADCLRCWCASCSKGDPWRYFQNVVTEVRDDSSEMTTALGNDDSGLFVKSKKVCPACYETNMVQEGPLEESS